MRHRKQNNKLGRSPAHRQAMVASLVCNLIDAKRIKTTLPKARQARQLAEKMVTLGRKGTLAARRQAVSTLSRPERVATLFDEIVPRFEGRQGGYARIIKLGRRSSDGSEMALVEWVGVEIPNRKRKTKPEDTAKKD
jgi:large subunit ribosomal protein L17